MLNSQFSSEARELLTASIRTARSRNSASASDENWELGIGQIAAMSRIICARLRFASGSPFEASPLLS
jgi:hypothetical protein